MPEATRCPRCGQTLPCGARDDTPCWCVGVSLARDTLAALAREYEGCLCGDCLRDLQPRHPGETRDPRR